MLCTFVFRFYFPLLPHNLPHLPTLALLPFFTTPILGGTKASVGPAVLTNRDARSQLPSHTSRTRSSQYILSRRLTPAERGTHSLCSGP